MNLKEYFSNTKAVGALAKENLCGFVFKSALPAAG